MKAFRISALLITLLLSGTALRAQSNPTSIVKLPGVRQITTDRAGDFYATTGEAIHKYDSNGNELHIIQTPSPTTLFDPGNGVRLLTYLRETQEYIIYPPSLSPREALAIDPTFAIEPWLVCSSGDYNLVILDAADWSVKKIDTHRSVVDYEFSLVPNASIESDYVFMREYQGFLFLLDRGKGIDIYNRLGMKLKSLPVEGLLSFNFLGQELYYFQDGRIHFTDLFTLETRSVAFEGPYEDVVIGNGRSLALLPDGLAFFSFVPGKTSETDR